jgi:hypothetical protein
MAIKLIAPPWDTRVAEDLSLPPLERTARALAVCEKKLAAARKRRDDLTGELQRVCPWADAGDKAARHEMKPLDEALHAGDVAIQTLDRELKDRKKWHAMAEAQAANAVRVARVAADAALPRDKWFEIEAPDGRTIRIRHSSREALQADLQPGYQFRGQVFSADANGKGGFSIGAANELLAFLSAHGVKVSPGEAA